MFLTKVALPRRTFLRGMGATVALPFLDAMVPRFPGQVGQTHAAAGICLHPKRLHSGSMDSHRAGCRL